MDRTEEAMGGGGDLGPVALGARRRPGSGGKRRGGRGGPIPLLTSGGGGLWMAGDGGGRRWPAMAVAAVLQTCFGINSIQKIDREGRGELREGS